MNLRKIGQLFQKTFQEWQADKASRIAAALAYYTVFSISPLLVIIVAIAGTVFGDSAVQTEITSRLINLIGEDGVQPILKALNNMSQPETISFASVISIGILILGASGIFAQLQDALNTIWKVKPQPGQGIFTFLRKRLSSFLMVLSLGFLLIISLTLNWILTSLSTVLPKISGLPENYLSNWLFLWGHLEFVVSFGLLIFSFCLMFKYVPDVKIAWKDVLVGSIITALLFMFGKFLLGLYISRGSLGSAYGAAGSLIIFLAWVYYTAQIILFGAEFTKVYARMYGSKIRARKHSQIE